MNNKYWWPLAVDPFTYFDRLKIATFVLDKRNVWTIGPQTEAFEIVWEDFSNEHGGGGPYGTRALFTSSGTSANQLLVDTFKYSQTEVEFKNTVVIVPSTTWSTSVTPWIQVGYRIDFCDINLKDFSFDYEELEKLIIKYTSQGKKVVIWTTALLGFSPNVKELFRLKSKYDAELFLDNCEGSLTSYSGEQFNDYKGNKLNCFFDMVTTSVFFSHFIITGGEGGFLFVNKLKYHPVAKMIRGHGLTRALEKEHPLRKEIEAANPNINPDFLFGCLGSNYRNSEIIAKMGRLDFKRVDTYIKRRKLLFDLYNAGLDNKKYYQFTREEGDVPLCLPIIIKNKNKVKKLKEALETAGIQTRPIVSSCLLSHPAFKRFGKDIDFKNSMYLNQGVYIGLNHKVTTWDIQKLSDILKKI